MQALEKCNIVEEEERERKANRAGIKLRGQIVSSGGSFRRIGVGVKCKGGEWKAGNWGRKRCSSRGSNAAGCLKGRGREEEG